MTDGNLIDLLIRRLLDELASMPTDKPLTTNDLYRILMTVREQLAREANA